MRGVHPVEDQRADQPKIQAPDATRQRDEPTQLADEVGEQQYVHRRLGVPKSWEADREDPQVEEQVPQGAGPHPRGAQEAESLADPIAELREAAANPRAPRSPPECPRDAARGQREGDRSDADEGWNPTEDDPIRGTSKQAYGEGHSAYREKADVCQAGKEEEGDGTPGAPTGGEAATAKNPGAESQASGTADGEQRVCRLLAQPDLGAGSPAHPRTEH